MKTCSPGCKLATLLLEHFQHNFSVQSFDEFKDLSFLSFSNFSKFSKGNSLLALLATNLQSQLHVEVFDSVHTCSSSLSRLHSGLLP
jgi:hypothetical protein